MDVILHRARSRIYLGLAQAELTGKHRGDKAALWADWPPKRGGSLSW